MEKHEVSKLIGAPPGYVGYEEGGLLTDRVSRNPYSVLLFDEMEKAHPDLMNVLLQVFDDGMATDAFGNQIDFKNTIIIMTSNVGSRELLSSKSLGFGDSGGHLESKAGEALKVLRRTLPPEFLNRIDEIVVFGRLGDDELRQIIDLLVDDLNRTLKKRGLSVALSSAAVGFVLNSTAADRSYGARPLRRAIQKLVEDPLAELMIASDSVLRGRVHFDLGRGGDALEPVYVPESSLEEEEGHMVGAKNE
jgi:ATP-dependent Clp protease ATP-binding subunit ClpC